MWVSSSGKTAHAAVGRIALVMALAAASGGLTSTIVSNLVQVANVKLTTVCKKWSVK